MSAALTYLANARKRANLDLRPDMLVDRVLIAGARCQGVVSAAGETIAAETTIISGGAYSSPPILLRSGIGPADELQSLGIRVYRELDGVGRDLVDHPLNAVDVPAHVPVTPGPKYQAMLTARSSFSDPADSPDLHVFPAGPFHGAGYSPTGAVQAIVFSVVKPRSRGWVRLRSADPTTPPHIHLGLLEHPDDMARALEAVYIARRLTRHPALRELIAGPELSPGHTISDSDASGLEAMLRAQVSTYHHPVGSCRMGPDPTAGAVVDAEARVHGIEGLRVVDASIMPEIPCCNTNLPTLMLAERVASYITSHS